MCPYVAKGLWRRELIYAKGMESYTRRQLMKMITWYFGMKTGFGLSPGKLGKNLRASLQPNVWTKLEQTYSDASVQNMWSALLVMADLFRETARAVAAEYGFEYPEGDDERVSAHLSHVRRLPQNAKDY